MDFPPGETAVAPACTDGRHWGNTLGRARQRYRCVRDDAPALYGTCSKEARSPPFLVCACGGQQCEFRLIGNPQNILIGQVGRLGFWSYFAIAFVPAVVGLGLVFACMAMAWRSCLTREASDAPMSTPAVDRRQVRVCAVALVALLVLFTTSIPREISALLIAACLVVS